jgi:hypothetical protein
MRHCQFNLPHSHIHHSHHHHDPQPLPSPSPPTTTPITITTHYHSHHHHHPRSLPSPSPPATTPITTTTHHHHHHSHYHPPPPPTTLISPQLISPQPLPKTWNGADNFPASMQWGFSAWNSSGSTNDACEAAYGAANAWQCFFGQNVAKHIKTPMFVLNSKYDSWQGPAIIGCSTPLKNCTAEAQSYWIKCVELSTCGGGGGGGAGYGFLFCCCYAHAPRAAGLILFFVCLFGRPCARARRP